MKILYLWPDRLMKELGGPKIIVEIAESMSDLGWESILYDPWTLPDGSDRGAEWAIRCHAYLRQHAGEFDVIEYDHGHLPFPREQFDPRTLMVARSGLLGHHFLKIEIPQLHPWRNRLRRLIKGASIVERHGENVRQAQVTCEQADIINVANQDDRKELINWKLPQDKIHVFPFGLSAARQALFKEVSSDSPKGSTIAFIGAYDERKGAVEFPRIAEAIINKLPSARFRLLGTKGRFPSANQVLSYFPRRIRPAIEVIPSYDPNVLSQLLADCSVGIFPSYIEGFPFGVLEMLSAALPVVAYNAPGASMMLAPEYLVERGNWAALADRVLQLLSNPHQLLQSRQWAKQRAGQFQWPLIARETSELYTSIIQKRRGTPSPRPTRKLHSD